MPLDRAEGNLKIPVEFSRQKSILFLKIELEKTPTSINRVPLHLEKKKYHARAKPSVALDRGDSNLKIAVEFSRQKSILLLKTNS